MTARPKADCRTCRHFRSAPYEARIAGCYLPANMSSKQDAFYLDEQQLPGDHEKINLRGACPDHSPRQERPPLWKRLLAG